MAQVYGRHTAEQRLRERIEETENRIKNLGDRRGLTRDLLYQRLLDLKEALRIVITCREL